MQASCIRQHSACTSTESRRTYFSSLTVQYRNFSPTSYPTRHCLLATYHSPMTGCGRGVLAGLCLPSAKLKSTTALRITPLDAVAALDASVLWQDSEYFVVAEP